MEWNEDMGMGFSGSLGTEDNIDPRMGGYRHAKFHGWLELPAAHAVEGGLVQGSLT